MIFHMGTVGTEPILEVLQEIPLGFGTLPNTPGPTANDSLRAALHRLSSE